MFKASRPMFKLNMLPTIYFVGYRLYHLFSIEITFVIRLTHTQTISFYCMSKKSWPILYRNFYIQNGSRLLGHTVAQQTRILWEWFRFVTLFQFLFCKTAECARVSGYQRHTVYTQTRRNHRTRVLYHMYTITFENVNKQRQFF